MMVIEHTDASDNKTIYPADRCSWRQANTVDTDGDPIGGYSINTVMFYPGNAGAENLSGSGTSNMLGFIGKSGRFVAISN